MNSALELYTKRVIRLVLLTAPAVAIFSGIMYTIGKAIGWYPGVKWIRVILFDCGTLINLALAFSILNISFDENGDLIPGKLKFGKSLLVILTILHWNMISYTFPSSDFYSFAPLFLLLSAFFLDDKLVLAEGIGLLVSILISWHIDPVGLGPQPGPAYAQNLSTRILALIFSIAAIYYITRLCNTNMVKVLELVSDYDPLTMVLNRRTLPKAVRKAEEMSQIPHTVAMLDLDRFKMINDTYGHSHGDQVLKRVAEIVSHSVSISDQVFRYGRDEFMILFSCNADTARHTCDRICQRVAAENFGAEDGMPLHITVSVGLAEPDSEHGIMETISIADAQMYEKKRNRN